VEEEEKGGWPERSMTWCNSFSDVRTAVDSSLSPAAAVAAAAGKKAAASLAVLVKMCPSCGHRARYEQVYILRDQDHAFFFFFFSECNSQQL
jgi:uncharacterized protein YbbK (DUF523 family)